MQTLVAERLPQLAEICRRYHVRRLELFGSAARDDFDPAKSDLDFLVEFAEHTGEPWAGQSFGLQEELEKLFGRKVDLVTGFAQMRNPYLRKSIEADRTPVYEA